MRNRLRNLLEQIEATPMISPLTGWWPFDEGEGTTARDLSGSLRTGTIIGDTTWLAEDDKPFLRFSGENGEGVRVGDLPASNDGFTLAMWARSSTHSFSGGGALASRRPAFALLPVNGSRTIRFFVTTASAAQREITFDLDDVAGFDITEWHHYAASYDAATGTMRLFVDGVERATADHPPETLQTTSANLYLGSDSGTASFAGDLSDIRLHPLALTPQRIANTASNRLDDADGDGMLSDWEHRYGLDPFDPSDADTDLDGDGFTNLEDFLNNTSPIIPDDASAGLRARWPLDETSGSLVSRRPQFVLHPWANSRRISFTVFHSGGTQTHCEFDLATIPGFSITDWHHYAGSYDAASGEVRLYVDGILRATSHIGISLLDSATGPLHIGRDVDFNRFFSGAIDEVFVYDRTLAPAEIMALTAGFDDDNDGLPDHFERWIMENSPNHDTLADIHPADDLDGDGFTVYQEWIAGTNPLDPTDAFRIVSWETDASGESRKLIVTIDGRAGRSYSLVESATLDDPWTTIASVPPLASDQVVELVWHDIPQNVAFVRARVDYSPSYEIPE